MLPRYIYIYLSDVGQKVAPIQGPSPDWNVLQQRPTRANLRIRPQKWPQKFLIGIIIGTALILIGMAALTNVHSAGEVGQDLGIPGTVETSLRSARADSTCFNGPRCHPFTARC
jgi:hypothetical protein